MQNILSTMFEGRFGEICLKMLVTIYFRPIVSITYNEIPLMDHSKYN